MTNRSKKISGFSIIELMMVVAIISVIVALSIPVYGSMQIKAARVEMKTNMRLIWTLAETYNANNNMDFFTFQYGTISMMGVVTNYCGDNVVGFKVAECTRLRYLYGLGHPDSLDLRKWNVYASARYIQLSTGSTWSRGYKFPTRMCKTPTSIYAIYYDDDWVMDQTGYTYAVSDMLARCF